MRINVLVVYSARWLVVLRITEYLILPNPESRYLIFMKQVKKFPIRAHNVMRLGA
jgi:hypothetical protein